MIYFRKWNFNLIPQIIEKSASIFRWFQSIFSHTNHFVAAKMKGIFILLLNLIKILYYVKFNRVDRYSRATPPLSGPDNPFGLPCQRGYKNKWTFWNAARSRYKLIFCFQVQTIELKTENFLPKWPAGADRWDYSTSTMLRSHKSTRWTKWAKVTLKTPFSFHLRLWFYVISTRTSRHRDELECGER